MSAQEPIALAIHKKVSGQIMPGLFNFFAFDWILVRISYLIGSIINRQGMIVWPGIAWRHDAGSHIHHGLVKISRPVWVNQNIQNFHKDLTAFRQGNVVFKTEETGYNSKEVAV